MTATEAQPLQQALADAFEKKGAPVSAAEVRDEIFHPESPAMKWPSQRAREIHIQLTMLAMHEGADLIKAEPSTDPEWQTDRFAPYGEAGENWSRRVEIAHNEVLGVRAMRGADGWEWALTFNGLTLDGNDAGSRSKAIEDALWAAQNHLDNLADEINSAQRRLTEICDNPETD